MSYIQCLFDYACSLAQKPLIVKTFPFLFLGLIVLLSFSPLLFGGQMIAGEESIGVFYPMMYFYQQAIRSGGSFLWDNFYYGGFPAYLNMLGGFLYPLHYILFKFLSFFTAYHLAIAIAVFIGATFSYLFGRANSFSVIGSLILALSYTLSQGLDSLTTTLSYANGFLVLPLLLFSILKIKQSSSFWRSASFVLLGTIGATVGFLAGFPQTVLYGITFVFFYALFLDWSGKKDKEWTRAKATLALLIIIAAGALLASPQLIPSFEIIGSSVRTSHYTAEESIRPPLTSLLTFIFPSTVRIPLLINGTPGIYVGFLSLLFVFLTVIFFRDRTSLFFLFSYLFIFAMFFRLPIVTWFNDYLPIFSRISNSARWLMVGAFPLSFLAAHGYEKLRNQPPEWFYQKQYLRFVKTVYFFVFFIVLGAFLANIAIYFLVAYAGLRYKLLEFLLKERLLHFSPEHYRNVFDSALASAEANISLSNWAFLGPLLLLPASIFILKRVNGSSSFRWFGPVVLSLAAINLFISFGAYSKEFVSQLILKEEPVVARVIKEREPKLHNFRFVPFLTGEGVFQEIFSRRKVPFSEMMSVHKEILTNNIGTFYGLENMSGFEVLRSLRQNQLLETVIAPNSFSIFDVGSARRGGRLDQRVNKDVMKFTPLDEKSHDFLRKLALLSMMNVKYILSFYPLYDSRLEEIKINMPITLPVKLYLYENKTVMPRVYFANAPVFWKGSERDLLIALAETADFTKKTFIECFDCQSIYPESSENNRPRSKLRGIPDGIRVLKSDDYVGVILSASLRAGIHPRSKAAGYSARDNKITIREHENGKINLEAESSKGGWLVFSESNIKGWEATIDEKRAPIYTANYLFQAIKIPAGEHRVEFRYIGSFRIFLEKLWGI